MSQANASLTLLIGKMQSGGKSASNIGTEWDGVSESLDAVDEFCGND
jgi:hypothetical protein